jgi:PEGA domain
MAARGYRGRCAPAGASVSVNGQQTGLTPYVASVPSSENLDIQIAKPGFQTVSVKDETSFRWDYEIWSFVEFVIPLGIDMADGAAWGHDQTMVAVHMDPLSRTATASDPATAVTNPAALRPNKSFRAT